MAKFWPLAEHLVVGIIHNSPITLLRNVPVFERARCQCNFILSSSVRRAGLQIVIDHNQVRTVQEA